MNEPKKNNLIKIVLLGECNVGKTTIFQRFVHKNINENQLSTIGIEFNAKNYKFNNKDYQIQIFDTGGQERFRSMIEGYYKMGNGFFVVFDMTNIDSLNSLEYWINSINDKAPESKYIIIGNKDDLKNKIDEKIIKSKLEKYKDIKYIKTSALKNININEAFNEMINLLENNQNSKEEIFVLNKEVHSNIKNKKNKNNKCC